MLEHLGSSLRAGREAVVRGVAPLGKGVAIDCEARLAVNDDKLTELAIMTLTEH